MTQYFVHMCIHMTCAYECLPVFLPPTFLAVFKHMSFLKWVRLSRNVLPNTLSSCLSSPFLLAQLPLPRPGVYSKRNAIIHRPCYVTLYRSQVLCMYAIFTQCLFITLTSFHYWLWGISMMLQNCLEFVAVMCTNHLAGCHQTLLKILVYHDCHTVYGFQLTFATLW